MANARRRVYRDYSYDDEGTWEVPEAFSPSPSNASDRADSVQTVVPFRSESTKKQSTGRTQDRPSSRLEYGIVRMTEEDGNIDAGALHPGYGVARSTNETFINDSGSDASNNDEPKDAVPGSPQIEPPKSSGFACGAAIAIAPDIRQVPPRSQRRRMSPISEQGRQHSSNLVNKLSKSSQAINQSVKDTELMENKMPEFYSMSVFKTALYNPTISHHLFKFGQLRLCGENMEFLQRAHKYQQMVSDLSQALVDIHEEFVSPTARSQINVPDDVRAKSIQDIKSAMRTTAPALEHVLQHAQTDIENLVYRDVYPKFVRHQMMLSAATALGGNRARYGGLGDCFVLTDPNKADNPIVFASDGFVKVTGFARKDIIPRNCRFLQGRATQQKSVERLRRKIEQKEESVELLLNHKKGGEPFWNLLYTAPLFDLNGKLIFFLGGQINCSTTIHSSSDVLRILAQSKESQDDANPGESAQRQTKPPPRQRILKAFRNSGSEGVKQHVPGMEDGLIDQIQSLPLRKQADTFYNAYSNYVIVNYGTYLISFISSGLLDLLFPIKTAKAANSANPSTSYSTAVQLMPASAAVGTDIFKFLANHGSGSMGWEFKSTIKTALKAGNPVSAELQLCSRPYMGFEKFVLHWTPLKDELGTAQWVVLTLGNPARA